jgi:hypothetical protein
MRDLKRQIIRSVQPQRMGRRIFLRGSLYGVGVSVGLPLLDIMLDGNGTRLAHGAPIPKRFGVYYWGGGVSPGHWGPDGTGTQWQPRLSLQPLGGTLKPYTTIVSGYNHVASSPGHIPARGIALSASHDLRTGIAGVGTYRGQSMPEPSVDALVAEHWVNVTKFPSLEARVCSAGPYRANSSWKRGGTTYNRHELEPAKLFSRVFGSGDLRPGVGILEVSAAHEKSMLDVLVTDAKSLRTKLGADDQRRLDQHLEGIRTLEQRLQTGTGAASAQQGCTKPTLQGEASSKLNRGKLHSEVLAHALACDLTRIFSYEWAATQSEERYPEVGMNTPHHTFTHAGAGSEAHGRVIRLIMQNYAYLGEQLLARKEGAGNVLDNTLIFGTTEHANAQAHNWTNFPFAFLGKAGGSFRAGVHHRGSGNASRLLLTAVHAVGVKVPKLGAGSRTATEPVRELLL